MGENILVRIVLGLRHLWSIFETRYVVVVQESIYIGALWKKMSRNSSFKTKNIKEKQDKNQVLFRILSSYTLSEALLVLLLTHNL